MENQEIDATKASIVPDENVMFDVIISVIGTAYDKEKIISDIKSGQIKSSDIMANPAILQKYLLDQNA